MVNKSTDIVFVTPSWTPDLRQESIGTLILAKKAIIENFTVSIVRFWEADTTDYMRFSKGICERILSFNPKIVSFYCRGAEYHILVDLANKLKEEFPHLIIVFGGPHAELAAEETIQHFSSIDYVCCGEGENTIVPLLSMLLKRNDNIIKSAIPGLVYRDSNTIYKNKLPGLLPDNYERSFGYYDFVPERVIRDSKSVTIDVGRGCPFSCTFCSTKTFWKQKFRLRNIVDTINEIEYIDEQFGNKLFAFSHDLFTVNKKRVYDFCDRIVSTNRKIQWTCSARIDCIEEPLIKRMVEAGLIGIYYGIETGSERMQRIINKNLSIQQCLNTVKFSIANNVAVTASFIYGFPKETREDLNETLRLIHQLMLIGADVQLHLLTFEKGSLLYNQYKDKLSYSQPSTTNVLGVAEMSDLILGQPEIFSTFWEYITPLRVETKHLGIFHAIGREYPQTYILLITLLTNKGMTYFDAYILIIKTIEDSLCRFENSKISVTKSICYFLFLKIISRLESDKYMIINNIESSVLKESLM